MDHSYAMYLAAAQQAESCTEKEVWEETVYQESSGGIAALKMGAKLNAMDPSRNPNFPSCQEAQRKIKGVGDLERVMPQFK